MRRDVTIPASPRPRVSASPRLRLSASAIAALALLAAACTSGQYPLDLFPEMHYQASQRRLEPDRLAPPEGAVPFQGRSSGPELYGPTSAATPAPAERVAQPALTFTEAATLQNPVPRTPDTMERARQVFRVNCALCHGQDGHGQSVVAQYFAQAGFVPPVDFASQRVRARADGQLYWIVTNGLGNMPPFANLLAEEERWMVVYVIREVQGP
ncbi:MAG: cytochrome c [Chloroflexi bacterium]|nr:cytochrome c [Chloroflexota bacterium]